MRRRLGRNAQIETYAFIEVNYPRTGMVSEWFESTPSSSSKPQYHEATFFIRWTSSSYLPKGRNQWPQIRTIRCIQMGGWQVITAWPPWCLLRMGEFHQDNRGRVRAIIHASMVLTTNNWEQRAKAVRYRPQFLTKFQTYAHSNYPQAPTRARLWPNPVANRIRHCMEDGGSSRKDGHGVTKVGSMLPTQAVTPRLLRQPHPQSHWSKGRYNWQSTKCN